MSHDIESLRRFARLKSDGHLRSTDNGIVFGIVDDIDGISLVARIQHGFAGVLHFHGEFERDVAFCIGVDIRVVLIFSDNFRDGHRFFQFYFSARG